ncbi:MAG TPA: LON peptidase substrate-binding domain-containing protein, partial [Anaerolineales bacterium]|nr:LON peptidase substrate-binding domain-containing protein [Anaerolineales bacterium]
LSLNSPVNFGQIVTTVKEDVEQSEEKGAVESLEDAIPSVLPILPLRGVVVYPMTAVPLTVGQPRSVKLIDEVTRGKRIVGLVTSKDPDLETPGPDQLYRVGTAAAVHRLMRAPDGTVRLLVQGIARIRVGDYIQTEPYLKAQVTLSPETDETGIKIEALARATVEQFQKLAGLMPSMPEEIISSALNMDDPHQLAYAIATYLRMDLRLAQRLLEQNRVTDKLRHLLGVLGREVEVLELGHKIQKDAHTEMEGMQREYFLREQLKAIQKELGEGDEQTVEIEEFRKKIEAADMPEEAHKEAVRELDRLAKLPTAAAEYGVIRTYLDWITTLPWGVTTADNLDVQHARTVLDEDHYGLD